MATLKAIFKYLPWILLLAWLALTSFMPVTILMRADHWRIENGKVSATITGLKILPCEYVKGSETGYILRGGTWEKAEFHYEADPSPGSTRPTGRQSFGIWAWIGIGNGAPIESVLLKVAHVCGGTLRANENYQFDVGTE